MHRQILTIETGAAVEQYEITRQIQQNVTDDPRLSRSCHVFVHHTKAHR